MLRFEKKTQRVLHRLADAGAQILKTDAAGDEHMGIAFARMGKIGRFDACHKREDERGVFDILGERACGIEARGKRHRALQ